MLELTEHAVDFLHRDPGAGGDATLARGLDELGSGTLLRRHGIDHSDRAANDALIRAPSFGRLRQLRRQLVDQRTESSHALHLPHLIAEIVKIETLAGLELMSQFLRLVDIDIAVRLFDQRQYITHAKDACRQTLGVKRFQAGELLRHADKFDRPTGNLTHRQGRTSPGIAVEFGQNHAGQGQGFSKDFRHIDRILTLHRIHHEQGFNRLESRMQTTDFLHHRVINSQTASGVHDQHIVVVLARVIQRGESDVFRRLVGRGRKHVDAGLARQRRQLLDGRRTIDVATDHQHFLFLIAQ